MGEYVYICRGNNTDSYCMYSIWHRRALKKTVDTHMVRMRVPRHTSCLSPWIKRGVIFWAPRGRIENDKINECTFLSLLFHSSALPPKKNDAPRSFCCAGWHNHSHTDTLPLRHPLQHSVWTTLWLPLCDLMNDTPISITAPPLCFWLSLRLPLTCSSSSNQPLEPNLVKCPCLWQAGNVAALKPQWKCQRLSSTF